MRWTGKAADLRPVLLLPLPYQMDGLVYCEFSKEDASYGRALIYTSEEFLEVLREFYRSL